LKVSGAVRTSERTFTTVYADQYRPQLLALSSKLV